MECNKTFLWFGVDFIALRYSTVIVILCNKNIDILQHNVLVVQSVSKREGFIRFASAKVWTQSKIWVEEVLRV